jgi:hypothetical protein
MPSRARRALSRIVLRGPALTAWTVRQYRRVERAYGKEILRHSTQNIPAKRPIRVEGLVRSILVIADCMWEQNEMVPDLKRKWDVALLDLHPSLQEHLPSCEAEKALRAIESFRAINHTLQPDVILLYAAAPLLSDRLFDALRQAWKCPIVGMNLDDKATFFEYGVFSAGNHNYRRWVGKFDLNITSTVAAVEWYHEAGGTCLYSPAGVNLPDDLAPPGPDHKFDHLLSFVGSARVERQSLIKRLVEFDVPVTLSGAGWGQGSWAANPREIYRSSQMNLGMGFSTATQAQTSLKARDFECPGAGACYLTTYNWELANHYEMGKEILCYRNVEELIEIFAYYRKRPQECLKIAQAAFRRARAEHTWRKRFENVFRELGLK